jgi:hypothetical protein
MLALAWHLMCGTQCVALDTTLKRHSNPFLACRNDPNYDSDEERSVLMTANSSHSRVQAEVAAYKQEVRSSSDYYYLAVS